MSTEFERLLIRLEADTTQLRRALLQADKAVETHSRRMGRELKRADKQVSSLGLSWRTLIGGATVGYAVREATRMADAYTRMGNRLAVVTKSTEELRYVQNALFANAQTARVGVEESVELYSRMAFALKDTGASTNELLQFTDTLNKSMIVSGATTAEATGALRQLSQGLAAGQLRGQELNSVMEQLPIVADMIAKEMGVTIGQLRKLGEQGKITGDLVFKSILGASDDMNAKFSKVTGTVEQGWTKLGNATLDFVGILNEGTDASNAMARALDRVSQSIVEGNKRVKESGQLMAFFARPGIGGYEKGTSWFDAIAGVPQWMTERLTMQPHKITDPQAFGLSQLRGSIIDSDSGFAPFNPDARGENRTLAPGAGGDPWNTTVIPVSLKQELKELKEQWDSIRDAQMQSLDDLIGDRTETAAAKMSALTDAVRSGSIAYSDFGAMAEQVKHQTERANEAMLSSTSQFLDQMFEGNKTAATASALVNTYQGITKALSAYPPPMSYAMAAMQAAMGFAQVRSIQSTSKTSTGAGGGSSVASAAAASPAAAEQAAAAPSQDRALTVQMSSAGDLIGRKGLRELLENIAEMQRDGYRLVVAG